MDDQPSLMKQAIDRLKQQRDELALKIHLGSMEAKDEWNRLNEKLAKLSAEYEPLRHAVGESAGNVFKSLELVADEIKDGFHRIRKAL